MVAWLASANEQTIAVTGREAEGLQRPIEFDGRGLARAGVASDHCSAQRIFTIRLHSHEFVITRCSCSHLFAPNLQLRISIPNHREEAEIMIQNSIQTPFGPRTREIRIRNPLIADPGRVRLGAGCHPVPSPGSRPR